MNRNFLVRLHRAGPWVITAVVVAFVALSPVIFRSGTGNSWTMRWLIFGGLVVLVTLIYAALSYGVLSTETRIGLAIATAQEKAKLAVADDAQDPYGAAVPGTVDAAREENGVRTTLLALGRKVQASAHRIQEEAGRMVQRHSADPDVLETSMRVDHAAAQQARLAQSIATLCGVPPGQQWHDPLPLADVVRAASGRITAYQRVVIEGDPSVAVEGAVAEPLIHMVAELLANATQSSPPGTQVTVTLRAVHSGAAIEVDDTGVGMDEADMNRAREVVSGRHPIGIVDLGEVPQTGLAVIGAYCRRHGFRVDLTDSVHGGVRAVLLVPNERLVGTGDPSFDANAQMFPSTTSAQQVPAMQQSGMQSGMQSGIQAAPMAPVNQHSGIQQAPMLQPMQQLPPAMQQQAPAPQQSGSRPMPQMPSRGQQGGQGGQQGDWSQPQVPPILQGNDRPKVPDYPDFSTLSSAPSDQQERPMQRPAQRPAARQQPPHQPLQQPGGQSGQQPMRPLGREGRPQQLSSAPPQNPTPPAQRTSSAQSMPSMQSNQSGQPPLSGDGSGETAGFTPDGLPQRRSRRSEAPAQDESFFQRRQVDTTPEPTAEQAGSWMSSFLTAGDGSSPTPDHDDWSKR